MFVIFNETFSSNESGGFVERYVCKHPLLRPEFIVVNDQVHGFKKASKKIASLEKFPIYIELEGLVQDENFCFVDCIDLYVEADVACQDRLNDIIYLSKIYDKYLRLERVMDVANFSAESLMITSKIQEQLLDTGLDELEGMIELQDFKTIFSTHLNVFIHAVKVLDEIIINNTSLKKVEKETGFFPKHKDIK